MGGAGWEKKHWVREYKTQGGIVHGTFCNAGLLKVKLQGGCWMHSAEAVGKQQWGGMTELCEWCKMCEKSAV